MYSQPTMTQPIACPPMEPSSSSFSSYSSYSSYSSNSSLSGYSDETGLNFLEMYNLMRPELPLHQNSYDVSPYDASPYEASPLEAYEFNPQFVYTPDAFPTMDAPTSFPASSTPAWSPTQMGPIDQTMIPPLETYSPQEPSRPVKPYGCEDCGKSFTRPADLKRHQTTVHYPVFQNCPVADCSRKDSNGFPRRDHLVEHLRSYHHMDVPKRRTTKRLKTA